MIRVRPSNKKDFLDIVGGQVDGRIDSATVDAVTWSPDGHAEFYLVWPDESYSGRLPSAVIIDATAQREFLAWTSTFVATLRPFTAHVRVMDFAALRAVQAFHSRPSLHDLGSPVLALVFAENFMAAESGASGSFAACRSTYSFAAARALALGASRVWQDVLAEGWVRLQRALQGSRSIPDLEYLLLVWSALDQLSGVSAGGSRMAETEESSAIVNACGEILRTGTASTSSWSRLCGNSKLADAPDKMSGPREQRVLHFEQVVQQLRESTGVTPTERAFACGYLASRVAVGSLEHLGLVRPLTSVFPGVQYWYALCAGLQPQSEVPHQSRGLGFRLLRDLQEQDAWETAPRVDIALAELEMLRGGDHQEEFWTSAPGVIEVELAPLISTIIRAPAARGANPQQELFQGDRREDFEALRRLGDAIDQAQHYYRRVAGPSARPGYERPDRRGRR